MGWSVGKKKREKRKVEKRNIYKLPKQALIIYFQLGSQDVFQIIQTDLKVTLLCTKHIKLGNTREKADYAMKLEVVLGYAYDQGL